MPQKIKILTGVLVIMLALISLLVAILNIWDILSDETTKELLLNTLYTLGATFLVVLVIIFTVKFTKE